MSKDLRIDLAAIQARADATAKRHAAGNSYPLDADKDREALLALVREQTVKLEAVRDLTDAAWDGHAYVLPGGYPSRPVESFDLRRALGRAK